MTSELQPSDSQSNRRLPFVVELAGVAGVLVVRAGNTLSQISLDSVVSN